MVNTTENVHVINKQTSKKYSLMAKCVNDAPNILPRDALRTAVQPPLDFGIYVKTINGHAYRQLNSCLCFIVFSAQQTELRPILRATIPYIE